MTTLLYDSTFEGLLTAVFEVFEYRYDAVEIIAKENYTQENLKFSILNFNKVERFCTLNSLIFFKKGFAPLR